MPTASTRLYQIATPPRVHARWKNFDGTSTIYRTDDAGLNRITLTLANRLGDTLVLAAGTPAPYGQLPAGESALYLFFEGLLTNAQVQAIQATFAGSTAWTAASFTDRNSLAYLALAPAAALQVPDGEALEFHLAQVLASASAAGPVYLTLAGATGLQPLQATTQVFVNVQNQPRVGNQGLDLVAGFAGNDLVFTGGGANDLTLYLTNPNPTPLVPGGASSWGPTPPTFQLSLVFGDTAGALTTLADAAGISVNVANAYGNVWKPVQAQKQGDAPTWLMQPDPDGGGQVLGTGAGATIEFGIAGITTELAQGLTFAYLSHTGFPGYDDGFVALEIVKVNPVVVTAFTATPAQVTGATGGTAVDLVFSVQNASYVAITNTHYAAAATGAPFSGTVQTTVYATTTFTLIATSFGTGQMVARSVAVTVSPDPLHVVPTGAIVLWTEKTVPAGWALCDGSNGTPDLRSRFVTSPQLWSLRWSGSPGTWVSQGSPPGVAATAGMGAFSLNGVPYAFVRGSDGALWATSWNGSAWTWTSHGTPPRAAIKAAIAAFVADDTGQVFVLGDDGNLWVHWGFGSSWQWGSQGSPPGDVKIVSPAGAGGTNAAQLAGNRYIAVLGSDGSLWAMVYDHTAGRWEWVNLGAPTGVKLTNALGGAVVGGAFPCFVALGNDGNVWVLYNTLSGWSWSNSQTPPEVSIAAARVVAAVSGDLYIFVQGSDNSLWQNTALNSPPQWLDHGTPGTGVTTVAALGGIVWGNDNPAIFLQGSDGNVWIRWQDDHGWHWSDEGRPTGFALGKPVDGALVGGNQQPYTFLVMGGIGEPAGTTAGEPGTTGGAGEAAAGEVPSQYALVYLYKTA